MTLDELVELVHKNGCHVARNKTVRDACGFEKLFDSVCSQIRGKLVNKDVAFGSPLSNDQEDHVLLYDNRKDSNIRKLLELAVRVQSGKEYVGYGSDHSEKQLRRAAFAAFQD